MEQNPYQTPGGDLSTGDDVYGDIQFFSPSSRIGRLRYVAHGMLVLIAFYAVVGILAVLTFGEGGEPSPLFWVVIVPTYIALVVMTVIFQVQRLHDLNQSGWWWLIGIVPLVNLIYFVYILFVPGTKAENNYGLRPPPNKIWHWVLALFMPLAVVGILAAVAIPAYQDYVERAKAMQSQQ